MSAAICLLAFMVCGVCVFLWMAWKEIKRLRSRLDNIPVAGIGAGNVVERWKSEMSEAKPGSPRHIALARRFDSMGIVHGD